MGPCIAGGAYLPALSDVILMVKGTSFMGLGGPNLVKGATGQTIDGETLGGAVTHTEISAVAHYAVDDDATCLEKLRDLVGRLPHGAGTGNREQGTVAPQRNHGSRFPVPGSQPDRLYDLLPQDHRMSYDMHQVLNAIVDDGKLDEFQATARDDLRADAIDGIPVGRCKPARSRQGPGREAAVRRNRLCRSAGRVASTSIAATGRASAPVRLDVGSWSRRAEPGNHSRRRPVRRPWRPQCRRSC
jgi:hypothetical protein